MTWAAVVTLGKLPHIIMNKQRVIAADALCLGSGTSDYFHRSKTVSSQTKNGTFFGNILTGMY